MALNTAALDAALLAIFSAPASSAATAGNSWANAIDAFAKTGEANGVFATVPPAATTALRAALGAQFATVPGSPSGAASGITSALDAYWLQVVFPGMTGVFPSGGLTLTEALETIFSVVGGTYASKASDIASAITAYTSEVFVEFPPGIIGPVG